MNIINLNDTSNRLYYIGGVVRDEILGKKCFDVDLIYVGNAIEYAKNLDNIEIIKINKPFGTVRIKSGGQITDIASTREEIYECPGHLPTVTRTGCSLKQDVLRRDFTINTLAKNYNTGEIVDYTGGLDDIKTKTLRVLHDKSFIDDPTRIIRALKFSVRFDFKLDEHSKNLRDEYLKNVNYDMSFKRVKKELIETFNLNSQRAYDEFIDAKIYKLVTKCEVQKPNLNIEHLIKKYEHLINPSYIWLIYAGTLRDLSNLELTRKEKKILTDLEEIKSFVPKNDFEVYKMFRNKNIETVILYGITKDLITALNYLENLKDIKAELTGEDLLKLGLKPSSVYNVIFDKIIEKKINTSNLTLEDEINIAKKYL